MIELSPIDPTFKYYYIGVRISTQEFKGTQICSSTVNKHLLRTCYILVTVPSTAGTVVTMTDSILVLELLTFE